MGIAIKTKEEISTMAEGGRKLAQIMEELKTLIQPGVSGKELNKAAEGLVFKFGGQPSFKGHEGFPAALCVCINEEIVHGVPSERTLKEGDIVTLDLGLFYKGFHADMAMTLGVGEVEPEVRRMVKVTKKALKMGIKKARPGNTFGDIGNTIQRYVESQGFGVVRDLCGHGIGRELHEDPQILNYGKRRSGPEIREGMVFCIEPMVAMGNYRVKKIPAGFGYKTADNSWAAHFEHTIAVMGEGARVLTNSTAII